MFGRGFSGYMLLLMMPAPLNRVPQRSSLIAKLFLLMLVAIRKEKSTL